MKVSMILGFASIAAALPAVIAPAETRNVVVSDTSVVNEHSAQPLENATIAPVLMTREDFERVVSWPSTSVIGGGTSFQYKAEPLGNDQFKITFYHSAPFSNLTFKYTVYAGDGIIASETLSAGTSSKSVQVSRIGESFRIVIQSV
ncbi:hypothetical protein BDP55DRAFT_661054 [Colletotrichum godetiae]|uniref:Uncharacterized protein n=1 Tax=Colletotrichum godetiae TaxID=1209918 RepID=A0AAJ0EV59_9PEZI|nr:uncharacterized protein BDP55DRAFT_661054 [Colletotrichum godetiae]KAK1676927.1 hypothetical protein BDP55DRAFT_661054 [Colletotrichum godetiae]